MLEQIIALTQTKTIGKHQICVWYELYDILLAAKLLYKENCKKKQNICKIS